MSIHLFKKVLNFSTQRYLKTAGDLFINHSDYVGALSLVEKALEAEPNDTRALVLYGDILFCLNRDVEALRAFEMALYLNPYLPEAYISKASVLEVLGRFREAIHCCKRALHLIGPNKVYLLPSLFDQEILLLIRMKRFREAQQVLIKAGGYLEPDEWDYLYYSYKDLLDQLCQQRQKVFKSRERITLHVVQTAS